MPTAVTDSAEETRALAASLAEMASVGDLVVLAGDLGAGKTCFAQGFARGLGVDEAVTSPTFTLANRYDGDALTLHHLDVYRIEDLGETLDLDLPELLESGVTLIEWGEEIRPVLPADHLVVRILHDDEVDDRRTIRLEPSGAGWQARSVEIDAALRPWSVTP